eukprot:gene40898-49888_t
MYTAELSFLLIILVLGYILLTDLHGGVSFEVNLIRSVLLRGISLAALSSLHSISIQSPGLIGEQGLHPILPSLKLINKFVHDKETLPWWSSDRAMRMLLSLVHDKFFVKENVTRHLTNVIYVDIILAAVSVVFPHPILFVYLYISYYAYKRVAGPFLNFQWDALLLEALLLSIPLSLAHDLFLTKLSLWLFKVLLFRLMWGSGLVKLFGRDSAWHTDYSAMTYHFLTQPLPSLLGMYMHSHLPYEVLRGFTVVAIVTEVHLPLLSLVNNMYMNAIVFIGYVALQLGIAGTGYYGFFNALTIVLSLALLRDSQVLHVLQMGGVPQGVLDVIHDIMYASPSAQAPPPSPVRVLIGYVSAAIVVGVAAAATVSNGMALVSLLVRSHLVEEYTPTHTTSSSTSAPSSRAARSSAESSSIVDRCVSRCYAGLQDVYVYLLRVFFLGSHYGLFAHMTKQRDEVCIQLSINQTTWHDVSFKYKPDDIRCPPKPIAPWYHLPRLDWCMWFVPFKPSLQTCPRWFIVLCMCILEANAEVLQLLHPDVARLVEQLTTDAG